MDLTKMQAAVTEYSCPGCSAGPNAVDCPEADIGPRGLCQS